MKSRPTAATSGTQSLERTFDLLRTVARNGIAGAQLTKLASDLDLPHPTVHRMLRALVIQRALVRDATTRRYHIGPLCFELGLATNYSTKLFDMCRPALNELARKTEDTIYLIIRSGSDAICVARIDARTSIRTVSLDVGEWRPLGVGAAGVALLAELDDAEAKQIIRMNAKLFPLYRGLTADEVTHRMMQARKTGIGTTSENLTEGISAFGIAVRTPDAKAFLGASVASITQRVLDRRNFIVKQLQIAAAEMAAAISSSKNKSQESS